MDITVDADKFDFNPHSRVGSDKNDIIQKALSEDFNPHSRVGSDLFTMGVCTMIVISIHTPA